MRNITCDARILHVTMKYKFDAKIFHVQYDILFYKAKRHVEPWRYIAECWQQFLFPAFLFSVHGFYRSIDLAEKPSTSI